MKKILSIGFLLTIVLISGCIGNRNGTPTGTPTPIETPIGTATNINPTVDIKGFAFNPITITISRGTTVTWTNRDNIEHTITGNGFDSGLISQDKTFSNTFKDTGILEYRCTIHPSMQGRVIVT